MPPADRAPILRPGPVGGRRHQNRIERTDALHRAALSLFLKHGIANVTVRDIAREAGTAKGNFYRYTADKRDLVTTLLAPVVTGFDAAFERCEADIRAAPNVFALTTAYLRLAMELKTVLSAHPDSVLLWLQEARSPATDDRAPILAFAARITERTIALTEVAHAHGLLGKIPPQISALAVIGAVEHLLVAHLRDHLFSDPDEVVRQLVRFVMEGIAPMSLGPP